uniref:Uncharacterized protein n=1 Tax=Ditylum brightwellii TaxID=49249 RepID=A0A7S1ZUA8_9STRA|mmetsp:Transcript_38700/g.58108  ORF Transcript_38700/g.58108 Transcript_38700/m.58108 type:complete len:255 (+) Transcript_38700:96-860(+)
MIAIKKLLLLTSLSLTAADSMEQMDPPIWPDQWHANFSIERWGNTWLSQSKNKGSYHYDWKRGRSLEEHGKGQKDNWCGCASKKSVECKVLSFNDDPLGEGEKNPAATYVVMPTLHVCCKLFEGIGGGALFPYWMKQNEYQGHTNAGDPKRKCQKWLNPKPGNKALMKGDLWMMDDNGIPCGYRDVFKWWAKSLGFSHYFAFKESSYSTEVEPSGIFALPEGMDCNRPCPNRSDKFKPWCSSAYPQRSGINDEL